MFEWIVHYFICLHLRILKTHINVILYSCYLDCKYIVPKQVLSCTNLVQNRLTCENVCFLESHHVIKSFQPIERPDPLTNQAETHEQVLKAHLSNELLKDKQGPTVEELGKMFFTTKHRFYPVGQ